MSKIPKKNVPLPYKIHHKITQDMKYSLKNIRINLLFIYLIGIPVKMQAQNDSIPREVSGVLITKTGNIVKMSLDKNYAIMPFANTRGELMKSFNTDSPGGTLTGWLSLAKMKVNGISGNTLEMLLLKETRLGPGDDAKKDRFISGQQVKFLWNEFATEDEVLYNKALQQQSSAAILAEFNLKRVIQMNPRHSEAFNLMGTIKEEQKVYDSAYYYYNRAYAIDTNNIKYLKNCSLALIHLERYPQAYDLSQKGIRSAPKDAYCYYLRAFSYLYIHKPTLTENDKAVVINDMAQSIAIEPGDPFYLRERANIRNVFSDFAGACEDAKQYAAKGGDNANDYIKRYCSQ
jgi:tetratricopeptide (TPR) repeat protein